ncbi:nitroreductase [Rhizobium sp. Root274]|uniref:nitroreductase family protein n=1 Tax=unclassified Rhizobium TaxID=2613769 RepID=UPI000714EC03|nr:MULTISPECIES: nitroreductase family protein [unclassified Rhizobium]KQW27816.1 nitroreductase [Rhizobium sp. Root1240]KRD28097.1 nitroreductase [Rhizobium sp. Root274]
MTDSNHRHSEYNVDPLFLDRWSPRAFDGSAMPKDDLLTILDAGHWAPSAFNYQPWRFVYGLKGTPEFEKLLGLLIEFNQGWARNASALVFVISDTLSRPADGSEAKSYRSHSFDAGAAWGLISLQAVKLGYFAHAMTGVDFDRAMTALNVPEGFHINAAVAVGKLGDLSVLPEGLRARETPSARKPLAEVALEGGF